MSGLENEGCGNSDMMVEYHARGRTGAGMCGKDIRERTKDRVR